MSSSEKVESNEEASIIDKNDNNNITKALSNFKQIQNSFESQYTKFFKSLSRKIIKPRDFVKFKK